MVNNSLGYLAARIDRRLEKYWDGEIEKNFGFEESHIIPIIVIYSIGMYRLGYLKFRSYEITHHTNSNQTQANG